MAISSALASSLTTNTAAASSSASDSTGAAGLTGGTDAAAGTEDRFLTLLVKQLQNQDPLNPMDNAQITSQIAQINTVKGIDKLNTSVGTMNDSMLGAQSLQASAMIGRSVVAPGSSVDWNGGEAQIGFDLAARAQTVQVDVIDPSTKATIYSTKLRNPDGSLIDTGLSSFAWHGEKNDGTTAAAGTYDFKVTALGVDGKSVGVTTYGHARVESVSIDGGVKVNTTALGTISMSSVKEIL